MFSLLYYRDILPCPPPFVKHYFFIILYIILYTFVGRGQAPANPVVTAGRHRPVYLLPCLSPFGSAALKTTR